MCLKNPKTLTEVVLKSHMNCPPLMKKGNTKEKPTDKCLRLLFCHWSLNVFLICLSGKYTTSEWHHPRGHRSEKSQEIRREIYSVSQVKCPVHLGTQCATTVEEIQFSSVQSLSCVWLFAIPWIEACQASLSITNSQSLQKLMPIESVMPSSHLILCCPLLLLPPIPPSMRVFSNVNSLHQVAKVLEFQLQHQSFQWTLRTDLL